MGAVSRVRARLAGERGAVTVEAAIALASLTVVLLLAGHAAVHREPALPRGAGGGPADGPR